jgi:hypothetical protein
MDFPVVARNMAFCIGETGAHVVTCYSGGSGSYLCEFTCCGGVRTSPQDFEATVAFWAAVFLPVAWIAFFLGPIAIVYGLLLLAFEVASLVNVVLSSGGWEVLISLLELSSPTAAHRLRRFIEQARSKTAELAWKSWGRAFGAFMLVFAIAVVHEQYTSAKTYLKPMIRGIAYLADYQQIPQYPGIDGNRRSRIHGNGIVSYAEDHRGNIIISVDYVRFNTSKEPSDRANID